jgi:type III secretion system YscQ/HrcQ family protein
VDNWHRDAACDEHELPRTIGPVTERAVASYPWKALDRLERAALVGATSARRHLERALRFEELGRALAALVSADVEIVVREIRTSSTPPDLGASAMLELADGSAELVLTAEPELVNVLVSRALGRSPKLASSTNPVDPILLGAFSALAVETARRTGSVLLRVSQPSVRAPREAHTVPVSVDATLVFDGRPYAVKAWVRCAMPPSALLEPPVALDALGEIEIAVPIVVALSCADRSELAALEPGDAWLPGAGWWIDAGVGRGALAAPAAERGVAVDLADGGRIVLRGETVSLAVDGEQEMADSDQGQEALNEAVLEAPVVVRIELGSVSMTAREWARLRSGDVIETGRRVAEPVILRIAGREVARGELVNVEGELGVRIRQIADRGRSG